MQSLLQIAEKYVNICIYNIYFEENYVKERFSLPISFTEEEMKILILFALKSAGGLLETEILCDVVASGDVNYISIKTVLAKVTESGLIKTYNNNGIMLSILSPEADIVVRELKNKIPITVREKVASAASVAIAKMEKGFLVKASVSKPESNGFCTVKIELFNDDGKSLLKMEVLSPTEMQGEMMAKKFKDNPSFVYEKVISALA